MKKGKKNRDRNKRNVDEGARKYKQKNSRFENERKNKETHRNIFTEWDYLK
jgi:hypothetical protein